MRRASGELRSAFLPLVSRYVAIIPTFDNARTLEGVVRGVRRWLPDVIVVDDGSGPEARAVAEDLGRRGLAEVVLRERNGGKGAAVKTGLERARGRGATHALQVDADGQHDLEDVPRMLEASRAHPDALVLGVPLFDESAPRSRVVGRRISVFWVRVETGGDHIADPLCGFRVYPVEGTLSAGAHGDRMDFDPEVAVRMVWNGVPVVHVPTHVRYLPAEEGGVSHFRMVRDNLLISWAHTRLCVEKLWRMARRRTG